MLLQFIITMAAIIIVEATKRVIYPIALLLTIYCRCSLRNNSKQYRRRTVVIIITYNCDNCDTYTILRIRKTVHIYIYIHMNILLSVEC